MNTTVSRTLSYLDLSARRAAERAARRAGMTLEDWLSEAIFERASASAEEGEGVRVEASQSPRRDAPSHGSGDEGRGRVPGLERGPEEDLFGSALDRLERRFTLNEERTARAFESIAILLERATMEATSEPRSPGARAPDENSEAADEQSSASSDARFASERVFGGAADTEPRPTTAHGAEIFARDLLELRGEVAGMARSLADLTPRNAVVALEGAIQDLSQRVALLRENGYGEKLLAPLERTASELRAALKEHDPRAATASLEREIRAVATKIEGLGQKLVDPDAFERIRIQTEEVHDLLAAAAMRTMPLEALERQIGELADRIERLGASPVPQIESAEMAASLAELRREIERNDPGGVLASIEQRLEHIAARLDEETARAREIVVDPRPIDDLAQSIEGIRQTLEARSQADPAESDAAAVQPLLAELIDRLDRFPQPKAAERPLATIETALAALSAKLESWAPLEEKAIARLAEEIVQRVEDRVARVAPDAIVQEIAQINGRFDALSASRADELEKLAREVIDKLREAGLVGDPARQKETRADLALGLAELRAEQASADRRTQARLAALQNLLEQLAARLAALAGPPRAPLETEREESVSRRTPEPILRSVEMLGGEDGRQAIRPRSTAEPDAEDHAAALAAANDEDFLLEPGAGAPQLAVETSEVSQPLGAKTSPAVTAHIAAARRAAQAALAESSDRASSAAFPNGAAALGAERVKTFYVHHRRSVLLAIALAVVAASAARIVVLHPPFSLKSETKGAAFKATGLDAPAVDAPQVPSAMAPDPKPVDTTPTASIAPTAEASKPREGEKVAPNLIPAIPAGASPALRDAVASGRPGAQYELAQRLFEGRGMPQNQRAAALWFERAAAAGLAPAQFRIGMMYEKGIGVMSDRAAAKRWYLQAAESGNARAAHNLAVMYAEPADEKPDYAEAAKWFRKAAELGVRDSQFNLGVLYARGLGAPQELGQSWLWFSLAAAQGDADAAKKRDEVASKMDAAALAAAAQALSKFRVMKPDPLANEVAAPPGGWDAKPAPSDQSLLPPASAVNSEKAS